MPHPRDVFVFVARVGYHATQRTAEGRNETDPDQRTRRKANGRDPRRPRTTRRRGARSPCCPPSSASCPMCANKATAHSCAMRLNSTACKTQPALRVTPAGDGRCMGGNRSRAARRHYPRPPNRFAPLPSCQLPASWNAVSHRRPHHRPACSSARSVGCYVPSGRHPLPSTLLMTAIPAQVAGVERIVVVSPKPAPETLAAAHLARHHGVLSSRRRARRRRTGLWNRNPPARRQNRRPRQSLRHCRQAPGRFRLRHRYARRTHRDCRHQRTRQRSRYRRPTSSRRPSTIPKRWPSSSPRAQI